VARTALSAPLPTKAVASDPIPTRLTEPVLTASVVASTRCNGIPAEFLSFSSPARLYQPISRLRLLSHPPGVLPCQGGLRLIVIPSNFSTITSPSSILPSVATGLVVCGHHRGYPVKNRAALLEPVTPPAKISSRTAEVLSKRLTGRSYRTSDTN